MAGAPTPPGPVLHQGFAGFSAQVLRSQASEAKFSEAKSSEAKSSEALAKGDKPGHDA